METETLTLTPAKAEGRKRRARAGKPDRGIFEKVAGSGVWWIRYVDAQGRYRREKAGTWNNADKLLIKRRNEALEGKKLPETLRRRMVTFAEIADNAICYVKKEYARPADDVARLRVLRDRFPGAADAVTADDIETVLDTMMDEKQWSASTRNHHHNLISLAYRLAMRKWQGQVRENPARSVERKEEDNEIVRFLSTEEEARLRKAIRSNPTWAPHEPELSLALSTGLRRSSMYQNLVWENVDLAARTAIILKTKSGEKLVVPLNDEAVRALEIFRSRGDGTGRVVRTPSGIPLNYNKDWFVPAVRAAGIANFRWHDCRHTFASRLRQAGVPLENIAELLGHSKKTGLAMTMRYAHLSIANLHEAVSRISYSPTVAPEPVTGNSQVAYLN